MNKKILFAARDPSSGNIVSVLAKRLESNKKIDIVVLGSNVSKDIFLRNSVQFIDTDKNFEVNKFFQEFKPDLIVTGASMGDSIERTVVLLARKNNIKSISILDFWVNYVERYSDFKKKFLFLPDYIFIMDDLARADMVKLGFPKDRLIVTGNPYFDTFIKAKNIGDGILYASNPKEVVDKKTREVNHIFDSSVLNALLDFLEKGKGFNRKEKLIIRPHPKDNLVEFNKLLTNKRDILHKIILDEKTDIGSLVKESRVVIGIYTTVLLQAALMGKIVISYREDVSQKGDDFICKRLGICYSVYNKKDFFKVLNKLLDGELGPIDFKDKFEKNATDNVIKEIFSILGI